jgi:hypothetical protein
MKFTSIVLTLSAVIAVTQVAALPILPQELGYTNDGVNDVPGSVTKPIRSVLSGPADNHTEAVENSPTSTPLTKRQSGSINARSLSGLGGIGGGIGANGHMKGMSGGMGGGFGLNGAMKGMGGRLAGGKGVKSSAGQRSSDWEMADNKR